MFKKAIVILVSMAVIFYLAIAVVGCAPTEEEKVEAVQEEEEVVEATTVEEVEEAIAEEVEAEAVKIGVIQITLEHEYQVMLNRGFLDKAEEMELKQQYK